MRSLMGLLLLLLLLLSLLMLLLLLLLLLKDDVVLGRRLNSFGRSGLRDEFLSGTDVPGPGFAECYETDFDVGIDLREIHEDKSETDREVDMGTDKNKNDTASLFHRGVYSSTQFYLIPPPPVGPFNSPPGLKGFCLLPQWRFIRVVFAFYACVCVKILRFFSLFLFYSL